MTEDKASDIREYPDDWNKMLSIRGGYLEEAVLDVLTDRLLLVDEELEGSEPQSLFEVVRLTLSDDVYGCLSLSTMSSFDVDPEEPGCKRKSSFSLSES